MPIARVEAPLDGAPPGAFGAAWTALPNGAALAYTHGAMKSSERGESSLEKVIDAVTESYSGGRSIDSLESAALPNQRQITDALWHLLHVVYMGFYSTRQLSEVNLRQSIGEHLYRAFETLSGQIARAVLYGRQKGGAPGDPDLQWSERAVLEVFERIPEIRAQLSMDVEAAFAGDPSAKSIEEIIFSYPSVHAITVYRLAHEFHRRRVPMIPRIMAEAAHSRTGIDIHPGALIGKRFFIDHGTGVVLGETSIIGDNVKIYQGVTLGALSLPRDAGGELIRESKRHPTLEDDVTIYAGATILGGETVIGRGSVIGGNVWLTESVPPYTRVTYSDNSCSQERQPQDTADQLPSTRPRAIK